MNWRKGRDSLTAAHRGIRGKGSHEGRESRQGGEGIELKDNEEKTKVIFKEKELGL